MYLCCNVYVCPPDPRAVPECLLRPGESLDDREGRCVVMCLLTPPLPVASPDEKGGGANNKIKKSLQRCCCILLVLYMSQTS